jgi:hypothetical protein
MAASASLLGSSRHYRVNLNQQQHPHLCVESFALAEYRRGTQHQGRQHNISPQVSREQQHLRSFWFSLFRIAVSRQHHGFLLWALLRRITYAGSITSLAPPIISPSQTNKSH